MPVIALLLLAGVFVWLTVTRRRSTLTRACRWRLDRQVGPGHYRCVVCGAACDLAPDDVPRHCLASSA